jgi:hypothetical protein
MKDHQGQMPMKSCTVEIVSSKSDFENQVFSRNLPKASPPEQAQLAKRLGPLNE